MSNDPFPGRIEADHVTGLYSFTPICVFAESIHVFFADELGYAFFCRLFWPRPPGSEPELNGASRLWWDMGGNNLGGCVRLHCCGLVLDENSTAAGLLL